MTDPADKASMTNTGLIALDGEVYFRAASLESGDSGTRNRAGSPRYPQHQCSPMIMLTIDFNSLILMFGWSEHPGF